MQMDLGGGAAEEQLVFSPMVKPRGILHDEPPGDILARSAPAQPSLHAHSISHLDCQGRIDLRGAARRGCRRCSRSSTSFSTKATRPRRQPVRGETPVPAPCGVRLAAALNSERASASRPARNRKSPLAAGNVTRATASTESCFGGAAPQVSIRRSAPGQLRSVGERLPNGQDGPT